MQSGGVDARDVDMLLKVFRGVLGKEFMTKARQAIKTHAYDESEGHRLTTVVELVSDPEQQLDFSKLMEAIGVLVSVLVSTSRVFKHENRETICKGITGWCDKTAQLQAKFDETLG